MAYGSLKSANVELNLGRPHASVQNHYEIVYIWWVSIDYSHYSF